MRRKNPDFSYKPETLEIINRYFEPWQLSVKDAREGFHTLLNRVVSLSNEVDHELDYITNKFLITRMDLAEEYVLYKTKETELYLSNGNKLEVNKAENIDNLVSGDFDLMEIESEYMLDYIPKDIVGETRDNIYTFDGNNIRRHNLESGASYILESFTDNPVKEILNSDIRKNHLTLFKEIDQDSIKIMLGETKIPYKLITQETSPLYNSAIDDDEDGVISYQDIQKIKEAIGKKKSDDDWDKYSRFDILGKGVITEKTYEAASKLLFAISPGIWGVIFVSENFIGVLDVYYNHKVEKPVSIQIMNNDYILYYATPEMRKYVDYYIYDEVSDLYAGYKNQELLLFRMKDNNITGYYSVNMPYINNSYRIYDLDFENGLLMILYGNDIERWFGYLDVRAEYITKLDHYFKLDILINSITYLPENRMVSIKDNVLYILKPKRNRSFSIDGYTYYNLNHTVYKENLTERVYLVPHFIFNSFDAFAFNIGIDRPLGYNNVQFRELIYDWAKYPQSNSRRGMIYGITRDLGFLNADITFRSTYAMHNKVYLENEINVNGEILKTLKISEDYTLYTKDTMKLHIYNSQYIKIENIDTSKGISITAKFYDYNENLHILTDTIKIEPGKLPVNIDVMDHGNIDYMLKHNYLNPDKSSTNELISIINELDYTHPAIYRNLEMDRTVYDSIRIPEKCYNPTIYNKNVIISEEEELNL